MNHDKQNQDERIFVTRPQLPPLKEVIPYLEEMWENRQLSNNGPLHQRLEAALEDYLGVEHLALVANGTLALVTALQAANLTGEVITTPYTFVATANALLWNNLTPVFVDVEPDTLNLDPEQVEAAITPHTSAILPVHVYGNVCDVSRLQSIADAHDLIVIYDAAHGFRVEDEGGSILRHGDFSILSFHATKVFNTFEGGAVVCPDAVTKERIGRLRNFGIVDETTIEAPGLNAKINEFQAAIGLAQLKHVDEAIDSRARLDNTYRRALAEVQGIHCPPRSQATRYNHAYFPIFVEDDYPLSRDELYFRLRENGIYGRRYFYPLIPEFPMYGNLPGIKGGNWPIAQHASERVICLPMYPDLGEDQVERIVTICVEAEANS
ncbi:dTDP-4-amino-4,6-dideoxy-D-glucose transaminase [wastewater metagenome]|uniref:dTDP-4-amino-4,6-dideoxy-D-glucose transaminase n=2 Tax=unclassified sequences TaxID=12908 RepID=A0A5B8RHA6_9ZZZZ|nr:DegT/DnrJ/EryC1/StrS family aminotransferase [Arhodomonas sp. KWT]QEA06932.1 dTDP-4-amino-4,6-dideoxy-D-glucose transaminase [uncultured organism]